jgi:hypothetical protein
LAVDGTTGLNSLELEPDARGEVNDARLVESDGGEPKEDVLVDVDGA